MRGWTSKLAWGALLLALVCAYNAVYVVAETQQALLLRWGKPVGVESTPGLKVKLPFVDTVILYDNRLLPLQPPVEQIILGDQKRLDVDTYTRFRIAHPLRFYQSVRTLEGAQSQLTQLVGSSLRRVLGQVKLTSLLSQERDRAMAAILAEVSTNARSLGIEVADVRIRRADLPAETSQAIYDRMKSERQREAKELRAQGFEWAQDIQSHADRDRTVLLAEAQRNARILRGQGDAEAAHLFAEAAGGDAKFYAFVRSLQTYRTALADAQPTLVLTPESGLLRVLANGPIAGGPVAGNK
jgi:modulator of FtsH protease HflC